MQRIATLPRSDVTKITQGNISCRKPQGCRPAIIDRPVRLDIPHNTNRTTHYPKEIPCS